MASGLSELWANKVLDKVLRDTALTIPSSYWVALFTNATAGTYLRANDTASATEVTGGSYARVEIRGATGIGFNAASAGLSENDSNIDFAQATASWGTVYAAALMDASTAGNVVVFADLAAGKLVDTGDTFRIPASQFDVSA